jgi:hypothetical protein
MEHMEKVLAIQFIRPNAVFNLDDNNLIWLDQSQIEPTAKEIEKGWLDYQTAETAAKATKVAEKAALLTKLGITDDEAKLLLS